MQSLVLHDGSTSMHATLAWLGPVLERLAPVEVSPCPEAGAGVLGLAGQLREAGVEVTTNTDVANLLASEPGRLVVLHGGGKLAKRLLRESRASLFVTPRGLEPFAPRRILVPLDGSERAEGILPMVLSFTQAFGAEVVLLRVAADDVSEGQLKVSPGRATTRLSLAKSLERARKRLEAEGLTVKVRVADSGSLDARILEAAHATGADLIATSTHGHGKLTRWLVGSSAERLLRRSTVPLLIRNASA